MFKRRMFTIFILIMLVVPLLSGCKGTEVETPTEEQPTGETTEAATEEVVVTEETPKTTDDLMSVPYNTNIVRNFNPFTRTAIFCTANCAFEPLMIINGVTGEIVPWLATAYQFSDDVTSLTLTLRDDVKWSDGEAFTADDVVFTFNMLRDKAGLTGTAVTAMGAQSGYIDTVTAPDDTTVLFTFKKPFSLALFDILEQNIVPEHIWSEFEDPASLMLESPVGTGPFTEIVNFTDEQYEVHRNPYYWQPDKVRFGGFKVTFGLSQEAEDLAIINGDFDWSGSFIPDIEDLYVSLDPEYRYYYFPQTSTGLALEVVTEKEPFNDVNVRKAISMAINRELITDISMSGYTQPADVTGLSSFFSAWKVADPSALGDWTTYNPDEANRLLDEAGYAKGDDGIRLLADGTPMEYELDVVGDYPNQVSAADIIVQNLEAIGIKVVVTPTNFGGWFGILMSGDFDLSLAFFGGASPYALYRSQMSATTYAPVGSMSYGYNYARFVSEDADVLLSEWESTADPDAQKEIVAQLQQIFAENAPAFPLYYQPAWGIFKTDNFVGFPSIEDPYAIPTVDSGNTNLLLVITTVGPR